MTLVRPTLAKIVATIGPASDSTEIVGKLIDAGVSVFRLNFSHGTLADHERRLTTIRTIASQRDQPIAVLGDLPGPKIRIGKVPDGGIPLATGEEFEIDPALEIAGIVGTTKAFGCTYSSIGDDVHAGHKVLINDGATRALAIEVVSRGDRKVVRCTTTVGGLITSGKGINLPGTELGIPSLTERDWQCVEWAVAKGIDYLALSFVRTADEVRVLQERLAGMCSAEGLSGGITGGARIPVIAKIEKPQAVANIEAIAQQADGLMVARGDLGVEMDIAVVPVVQRQIIRAADRYGKPCIVATQMLESMTSSPQPTRAEASDVANAIYDEADAVMLSAESASGQFPVIAVETMRRIIEKVEEDRASRAATDQPTPPSKVIGTGYPTAALAHGAWWVAKDIGAKLVVVWSQRGGSARYLSQTGLSMPIIAMSSSSMEVRRMALLRGVSAIRMDPPPDSSLSLWNQRVDQLLLDRGWAKPGDPIVLLAGRPLGVAKSTNILAIHYVGQQTSGFYKHM